ncbi:MAG: flagellar basal-body MS-ring/collar protein FliF [Hyphomonas sp.]
MNFLDNLRGLPLQRQLVLVAAVIGVSVAMMFMVRGAMKEPMVLLYAGLDPQRAGEIIGELDQSNVEYEITQESIFVPRSQRDGIRFSLAQKGLPKQAVKGYELLDDVNGFSVTSEMYNASYWRAKEGELTRTILAIRGVDAARVHIGASLRSGFSRSKAAQTASVTLTTTSDLSTPQAEAIQYMVALAVSGLNPKDVVVIDPKYGIIAGPNMDGKARPMMIAEDQSSALEEKILRLLEARLGPGNAQVSVSLDVRREHERISQVSFDPESQVVRQRSTTEVSAESTGGGGGALTVASNLPQGTEEGGEKGSSSKNSTENVAYELNETRTEIERLPGEITRMSIAVLVNELALGVEPDDVTAADAMIAEFEALIASGAGLNLDRGDSITVNTMPFTLPVDGELTPAPSAVERFIEQHMWSAVQALLLTIVTLVLGMGVIKPILSPKRDEEAEGAGAGNGFGLDGEENAPPDAFDFLKDYAREREEETAALLQDWLAEDRGVAVNE